MHFCLDRKKDGPATYSRLRKPQVLTRGYYQHTATTEFVKVQSFLLDRHTIRSFHNDTQQKEERRNGTNEQMKTLLTTKVTEKTTKKPRRKWKRPADKPKRPLSSYNLYFKDVCQQMAHRGDASDFKASGINHCTKFIANKWKSLDQKSRSVYEDRALEEKKKYSVAMAMWRKRKQQQSINPRNEEEKNKNKSHTGISSSVTKQPQLSQDQLPLIKESFFEQGGSFLKNNCCCLTTSPMQIISHQLPSQMMSLSLMKNLIALQKVEGQASLKNKSVYNASFMHVDSPDLTRSLTRANVVVPAPEEKKRSVKDNHCEVSTVPSCITNVKLKPYHSGHQQISNTNTTGCSLSDRLSLFDEKYQQLVAQVTGSQHDKSLEHNVSFKKILESLDDVGDDNDDLYDFMSDIKWS